MKPRGWLIVACVALLGVLVLAWYPARSYLDQNQKRQEAAARVAALDSANQSLEQRAQQLQTDAEIERLARRDYNLVKPGEEVYAVTPPDPSTTVAPAPAATSPKDDRSLPQKAIDWVTGLF